MTLKVIGAGLGRTGTSSLQAALEELGFGKCYHMREVFAEGNQHHAAMWLAATENKPVNWEQLFAGYQSTVDWPGCTFYKELMDYYPNAKVLLSVRDPEKWYSSARSTIFRSHPVSVSHFIFSIIPRNSAKAQMLINIWPIEFREKFVDKDFGIDFFNRHNAEVQRVVPPERLLVYDVKQGWEPLCAFLGVPVPDKPFPRLNETAEFQRRTQQRERKMRRMVGAAASLVALGVAGLVWRLGRRRAA
ncbi:MAG: sulfotransferase family protein [Chloroflexi bacterium]|nr:sulfotransferase family protein [Chloroflexota bacterium]